jgi:thymidylate synthase (FAD)
MVGATIEVQAPIFVFREWHRHRVPFSYNEMSARYTPLPDVNYVPTVQRMMTNSATNKQAGTATGADELDESSARVFQADLELAYAAAERLYQAALKSGVPKELARVVLPVGRYSRMRASSNLRGWLNFLALRMDEHAQFEIRCYAHVLHDMLARAFPRTLSLFDSRARKD